MSRIILVCFVMSCIVSGVVSQQRCNHPTPTPPSYWESNPNCAIGFTYETVRNNRRFHCHCWGHCGYICDPRPGGGGVRTSTTTTRRTTRTRTTRTTSTTRRQSPCPFGGVWIHPTRNLRCHCQSFMHVPYYICEAITSGSTTATGSTTAGTTAATTAGSTSGSTGSTTSGSSST